MTLFSRLATALRMSLLWVASVIGLRQASRVDGDAFWELTDGPPTQEWAERPSSSSWSVYFRELDHIRFDMEFPRMHALIHWLHAELWECTLNFVQKHKLIEKVNPQAYVAWSKESKMLEFTEWEATEERELTDWTFLIGHTNAPEGAFLDGFLTQEGIEDSVMGLLRSADEIRHAAAHHWSVSVGDLFKAMLLPRVLKDIKRADRIERIFYAISDEAGHIFDEHTRKEAELTIFTFPCDTVHQKLARLESLLQPLCFEFAERKDPNHLSSSYWHVPENVEISKLGDWRFKTLLQDDFPDVKFDSEAFHGTIAIIQDLRNCLWHRNPVSDTDFLWFVHAGIRFAVYTGNRAKAIEIEVKSEMMLTGNSRENVLARLRRVFIAAGLPDDEDDRRRECRRRVAIGKVLEESGIELSNRELITIWNYMLGYPRPEEPFQEETFIKDNTEVVTSPVRNAGWPIEEGTTSEETYYQETYREGMYQETGYPDTGYQGNEETDCQETDYQKNQETDYEGTDYEETDYEETDYQENQETDMQDPGIQETMAQVANVNCPKEDERTDDSMGLSEVSPSATLFSPGAISYRLTETLYTKDTTLDQPLAATTPETAVQHSLADAAEDEDNIDNFDGSFGLGIDSDLDLGAASTDSSPNIPLLTFSPSMHECLKW